MNWLTEDISLQVRQDIMPGDHMYSPQNPSHYFGVGRSALRCIAAAAIAVGRTQFSSICDFACGSGRVTRYLRAAFPEAKIVGADLRQDSLSWLEQTFDIVPWVSDADFSVLQPPYPFDLFWSGSLVTHLGAEQSSTLLHATSRWLSPGGIAIVTTHGRRVLENRLSGRMKYISDEDFEAVRAGYQRCGFGYVDYPGRKGIGFSICSPDWVTAELLQIEDIRIIGTFEYGWDGHQDVIMFQKRF
jgi:SAM-dependent methyltransferase